MSELIPSGTRGRHNKVKVVSERHVAWNLYHQRCTQFMWYGGANYTKWLDTAPQHDTPHRCIVHFSRWFVRRLP